VQAALREVTGTYGIAVICADEPDKIVGARKGSPLIVGVGNGEYIVASDVAAIVAHTTQVIYLDDYMVVKLTRDGFARPTSTTRPITKRSRRSTWDLDQIEKGGFEHFMLKEIFEQPETIRRRPPRPHRPRSEGDVKLGGLANSRLGARRAGASSSWPAAPLARRPGGRVPLRGPRPHPTEVEYASEFRYRNPIIEPGTVVLAVSQSGETADTLEALREAKRAAPRCSAWSTWSARPSPARPTCGVYIHAGPEIGVASPRPSPAR
jgi:glucosamine--fructose-6-phosphate aminotransferase (isomerizing)